MTTTHGEVKFSGAKSLKVVKSGPDVYSVFEATNTSAKRQDIFLSVSHDNGKNYTVTDLSNGQVELRTTALPEKVPVENSSNPQIAMDKHGGIYMAWNAKAKGGNPSYVVLAISEDKFETLVVPYCSFCNSVVHHVLNVHKSNQYQTNQLLQVRLQNRNLAD